MSIEKTQKKTFKENKGFGNEKHKDFYLQKKKKPLFDPINKVYIINVLFKPNNIFLSFSSLTHTIIKFSSGKFNFKITKKKLRYGIYFLIFQLKKLIKKYVYDRKKYYILKISSPVTYRSFLLNCFKYVRRHKNKLFIEIDQCKAFNGCRSKKEIRKKGYRSMINK